MKRLGAELESSILVAQMALALMKKPAYAGFFMQLVGETTPDQKSRLDTDRALLSMKSRRGSTASPIRVLKI